MDTSPAKRRVLAPLDANAQSPASSKTSKIAQAKPIISRDAPTSIKRNTMLIAADEPAAKRQCITTTSSILEHALPDESTPAKQDRGGSASPEPSSIFDNSAIDTSQVTCATESDTENPLVPSPPRPVRRPTITREEARQKAEVLRLRLGLAGYKLRTGQEHVPLERLQVRRIHDDKIESRLPRLGQVGSVRAEAGRTAVRTEGQQGMSMPVPRPVLHAHPSPEKNLLPRLPAVSFNTPTRKRFDEEEGLTSSAIKGGAAKGLLSLSRG